MMSGSNGQLYLSFGGVLFQVAKCRLIGKTSNSRVRLEVSSKRFKTKRLRKKYGQV